MEENKNASLDVEFKRYLQIMRPHLEQLLDDDVIDICKAWIQRLSDCKENEKKLRNKYVFALCHQLATGILSVPFLKNPSMQELSPLDDDSDSDISDSETECILVNSVEDNTNILLNNNNLLTTNYDLRSDNYDKENELTIYDSKSIQEQEDDGSSTKNTLNNYSNQAHFSRDLECHKVPCDEYKYRANNLVTKLREIKTQNTLLTKEVDILRQELKTKTADSDETNKEKKYKCTSTSFHSKESMPFNSLTENVRHAEDSEEVFFQTIDHLKTIEDCHKIDFTKKNTSIHEKTKEIYENKIKDLKQHYEVLIENIQMKLNNELQEVITTKDQVISDKEKIINDKNNEIIRLRNLNDDQKTYLQGVINNFLEKSEDDANSINRQKAEQLEKRLNKTEKSKAKCIKMFEAKLAHMQREKYLVECSLQLHLVRHRAQVVNDVTEENQTEVNTALNKLESKYKEIVANMQATAIQRRLQDQMAIDSILQAATGIRNGNYANCSRDMNGNSAFSGKTIQNQNRNGNSMNQSCDSELSTLLNGNKVHSLVGGNKSVEEESVMAGYCLDDEGMGELFERVYIPQRDIGDGPLK